MKITQIVKKLNNTELGKGGTHDTYVLIPNDLEVSDVFCEPNVPIEFIDKETGGSVTIRNTVGREKRIVGLGQYYREKDLCAGDEIIFERLEDDGQKLFISTNKYDSNLVIQKSKYGFELLSPEKVDNFKKLCEKNVIDVEIKFLIAEKKRNDSPEETKFYDVLIDGISMLDNCSGKEIKELRIVNNLLQEVEFYGWKKYVFGLGD